MDRADIPPPRDAAGKRGGVDPAQVFLAVVGLNTLLLVFLTPPFQVHDEFQHFFRAYQVSEGRLWGFAQNQRAGDVLPASLQDFVLASWGTLDIWTIPPLESQPLIGTLREWNRPLLPDERAFADFAGAVVYSPLAYLPQAMGIYVGRQLDLSPLHLLQLGRLANAIICVATIFAALRLLPAARWTATAIAALPMAQFEYASVAPDGVMLASAYLFTALAARASADGSWPLRRAVVATMAGLVFCSVKIVYAPIMANSLVAQRTPGRERQRPRTFYLAHLAIMVVVVVGSWLWLNSTQDLLTSTYSRVGAAHLILLEPVEHAARLARDLAVNGTFYLLHFIGIFGAYTVPMPVPAYVLAVSSILAAALVDRASGRALRGVALAWSLLLLLATVAAIQTALYILATEPASDIVHGVQGRYFLPLGAPMAVALQSLMPGRYALMSAHAPWIVAGMMVATTILMDLTIVVGFGLF